MKSLGQTSISGHQRRAAWFEVFYFVMALVLVLWVAQAVRQHGQEGVQRWQKDTQQARFTASATADHAIADLWCQRDQDLIAQWFPAVSPCPFNWRSIGAAAFRGLSNSEDLTHQRQLQGVQRWQQELMRSVQQWRSRLMGMDAALIDFALASNPSPDRVLSEAVPFTPGSPSVQLEPQLADDVRRLQMRANERLVQWDNWVAERALPLVQAPASEVEAQALWAVAQSLAGEGTDAGARMVSQALKASANARRAEHSLKMLDHLPFLLAAHAIFTLLVSFWTRAYIAPVQQFNGLLLLGFMFWGGLFAVGVAPSPMAYPLVLTAGAVWMVLTWILGHFFPHMLPVPTSTLLVVASWIPSWWLFTALGWLLLLDQSLHFHERLRFLALEQWWAWCLSALLLPLSSLVAPWALRTILRWGQAGWSRWPSAWPWLRWCCALLGIGALAIAHRQHVPQHVTGELLKAVFVLALCSWCVWKMPITAQLWHAGHARVAWRGLWSVLMYLTLAAVAAFMTADKGPLLVMALLVAVLLATVLGWTAGMGMLMLGFAAIFWLGVDLDVVGERLQAWRDPFTANHDDMARVVWFQTESARWPWGFGVGQVPWCGTSRLDVCHGLPLQLQSDYTFTALMGWWGPWGAWLCLLAFTAAVYRVLMYCARQSPPLLTPLALLQTETVERAWALHLLFLFSVLMLMQTWITVAGNLGWLPLTGLTWPLMGYGKTSLWISTMFVGAWGLRRSHA